MAPWSILSLFFVALLCAQAVDEGHRSDSGIAILLLPASGVPVSFEQIEERSKGGADNSSVTKTIKSEVYRDSYGRVRILSPNYSLLIDPVEGSRIVHLSAGQVAYRTPWPKSEPSKLAFFGPGLPVEISSTKSTIKTEVIGTREFDGVVFDGTRITQGVEGEPQITQTVEQWYSNELKLVALVTISTPQEIHTARIQKLCQQEPDEALFKIPDNYKILDVSR